jgi:hypothetical protein
LKHSGWHSKEKGWNGGAFKTEERYKSNLAAVDPISDNDSKAADLATTRRT